MLIEDLFKQDDARTLARISAKSHVICLNTKALTMLSERKGEIETGDNNHKLLRCEEFLSEPHTCSSRPVILFPH